MSIIQCGVRSMCQRQYLPSADLAVSRSVGSWESSEHVIERPILLHNEHHMTNWRLLTDRVIHESDAYPQNSLHGGKISFAMFPSPQRGDYPARPRRGAHLVSQNAEFQQATAVPGIAEATGRRAQICELRDFLWGLGRRLALVPVTPGH